MGLDMYLNKKTYIGAEYEHRNVKGNVEITINDKPINIQFNRISEISERVGYWRKANAIHNWFVENVQDGEDNCQEYWVGIEKLQELVDLCKSTIEIIKKCPIIEKTELDYSGKEYKYNEYDVNQEEIKLQTAGGFFFGSTAYNDYYLEDLQDTINQLEPLIKEGGDYYYQSSW